MVSVAYFNKVTAKYQQTAPAAVINNGCGNQSVPAWTAPYTGPSDQLCSYIPYEETTLHYDPSKGRKWAAARRRGEILMSEYMTGTDHITRSLSSIQHVFQHASYTSTGKCSKTQLCAVYGPISVECGWTENYSLSMLSALPSYGKTVKQIQSEVPDLVSSTRQAAYAKALNTYDLLTELGELGDTLGYLLGKVDSAAKLLSKFRANNPAYHAARRYTPKQLLRSSDKELRRLGARWMEWRYALMPILYSIDDVRALVKGLNAKFQTDRSSGQIDIPITTPGTDASYVMTQVQGFVRVQSVTKASFLLGSLQRLFTLVGANPFRTGWELVPLSFVADWLFNFGDAITALTGLDYSSQRMGCTSVRSSLHEEIFHHVDVHDSVVWTWPPNSCGYAPAPWDYHRKVSYHNKVSDRVINTYVRSLWSQPQADIVFDPYLNWKRIIDGLVLSYQPTKQLLRSLK